jgi:hypothetical protein
MAADGKYARLYRTLFREQKKHLEELEDYTKKKEAEIETFPEFPAKVMTRTEKQKDVLEKKRDRYRVENPEDPESSLCGASGDRLHACGCIPRTIGCLPPRRTRVLFT